MGCARDGFPGPAAVPGSRGPPDGSGLGCRRCSGDCRGTGFRAGSGDRCAFRSPGELSLGPAGLPVNRTAQVLVSPASGGRAAGVEAAGADATVVVRPSDAYARSPQRKPSASNPPTSNDA